MQLSEKTEALIDGLVGGLSAAFANAFLNPLHIIRLRLSAHKAENSDKQEESTESGQTDKKKKEFSSLGLIRQMLRQQGIKSFYKGVLSNCFGIFYAFAFYFFFYRLFQRVMLQVLKTKQLGPWHISLATFVAGGISTTLSEPIWKINARIVNGKDRLFATISKIYKQEGGLKAFFTGLIPGWVLLINPIINYSLYEELKRILAKDETDPKGLWIIIAALLSKAIATVLTYPMVAVKSRLMSNVSDGRKGLIGTIKQFWQDGGVGAFYRGFFAKFGHSLCYYAFMMLAYEKVRRMLKYVMLRALKAA